MVHTCHIKGNLEAVLSAPIAGDTRIETSIPFLRHVNDQRMKAVLVHYDLVVLVVMNL